MGTPGLDHGTGTDQPPGPERSPVRTALVVAVVTTSLLAVALSVTVAVLLGRDSTTTTPATPASPSAPTTTVTPREREPGGTDALDAFLGAAETLDAQLRAAAAAINGTGPPWNEITDQVAASVQAADISRVARTIPAGLPDELRRLVFTAYSDLVSRRAAMESFAYPYVVPDPPPPGLPDLVQELANGAPAAARFPTDLGLVEQTAATTSGFTPAPDTSRDAAEVVLLVRYVEGGNFGCGSRGGFILTSLPPIVWKSDSTGTVGAPPNAVEFEAQQTGDGWEVTIFAC